MKGWNYWSLFLPNTVYKWRHTYNIFLLFSRGQNEGFSAEQVEMYKECFKLMDIDKDGTISKNDLRYELP